MRDLVGLDFEEADLKEADFEDVDLEEVDFGPLVRVDRVGVPVEELFEEDFLVEELPEVRLRVGVLDRLAMSREYPWVAGITGVTGVTRVADLRGSGRGPTRSISTP